MGALGAGHGEVVDDLGAHGAGHGEVVDDLGAHDADHQEDGDDDEVEVVGMLIDSLLEVLNK